MKAALQHVKDVLMNVFPVQTSVRGNPAWSSAQAFVGNVLTYVGNVQMPAETTAATLHNCFSNVPMPVAGALKNAKNMMRSIVSVVPKSAEDVLKNAGKWQFKKSMRALEPLRLSFDSPLHLTWASL